MSLVQIPWQPYLWVHHDFLARLTVASNRYGRNILLNTEKSPLGEYVSAWRSWASTVYLWNGFVNHLPGFNSASNPNNGPRSHQRGVGGDLATWPSALKAALQSAGIQVDGVHGEPWHIQLPNFMAYPIISTNTGTAGGSSTKIPDTAPELPEPPKPKGVAPMLLVTGVSNPENLYLGVYDGNGNLRVRFVSDKYEKAMLNACVPPLPRVVADDSTLEGWGKAAGYEYGKALPLLKVDAAATATVDLDALAGKIVAKLPTGATAEAIATAVRDLLRTDPLK